LQYWLHEGLDLFLHLPIVFGCEVGRVEGPFSLAPSLMGSGKRNMLLVEVVECLQDLGKVVRSKLAWAIDPAAANVVQEPLVCLDVLGSSAWLHSCLVTGVEEELCPDGRLQV
jgi:hypothetical protein